MILDSAIMDLEIKPLRFSTFSIYKAVPQADHKICAVKLRSAIGGLFLRVIIDCCQRGLC